MTADDTRTAAAAEQWRDRLDRYADEMAELYAAALAEQEPTR